MTCKRCKTKSSPENAFCEVCGVPLCKKSAGGHLLTAGIALCLLIVGIGGFLLFGNRAAPAEAEIARARFVVQPTYSGVADFVEGLAAVYVEDDSWHGELWGIIDRNGNEVIALQYRHIFGFQDGIALVAVDDERGVSLLWGMIDRQGNYIIPPMYHDLEGFNDGLARMAFWSEGGRQTEGFVDRYGNEHFVGQFDAVQSFSEGLAAVRIGNRWGFIDTDANQVIPPVYDMVFPFFHGTAAVLLGDGSTMGWGLIDRCGNMIVSPVYEGASRYFNGLIGLIYDGRLGFADATGHVIIESRFDAFVPSLDDKSIVVREHDGDVFGLIDDEGNIVIEPRFEAIQLISKELVSVQQDGLWGLYDRQGNQVLAPQFLSIYFMHEGLAFVTQFSGDNESAVGVIDSQGNIVIEPIHPWRGMSHFSESVAAVGDWEDNWHIIIVDGDTFPLNPRIHNVRWKSEGLMAASIIDGGEERWGFLRVTP